MQAATLISAQDAAKQAQQQAANNKYDAAIANWKFLSSDATIPGQFFKIFDQLGGISTSISKILGTVENTIKIMGL